MIELTQPTLITGPTSEPVTLTQAKKQLEIPVSDTTHDDQVLLLIEAARQQWEHDTDSACLTQTWRVYAEGFCDDFELEKRPIQSITSIKYYDTSNTQQTLSSSVYSLNAPEREIELGYLQVWPATVTRWDTVEITYVAGYTSASLVPAVAKQAMLLLIGNYFEDRDMLGNARNDMPAYEALVKRFMRSSYP